MVCYERLILSLAAVAALVNMGGESFAQSQPRMYSSGGKSNFEKVLRQSFPVSSHSTGCYAQTNTPRKFDLTRLCGSVMAESNLSGAGDSASSYSGGSNASSSGICNTPNDIASNGSRCGGRAASEKKGGR
jgi:hypothetical protein